MVDYRGWRRISGGMCIVTGVELVGVSIGCMSCDRVGKRQGVFFGYIWKDSLL